MKITGLKTAVVEGNFDWTYVRVESDEGVSGLGECFFAPGLTQIIKELEPVLLGQDPRDVRLLFRKLQMATSGAGSVAGIVYNAITGIEMALWELNARWMNVPLYRLLGGKFRDKVRMYVDCHAGESLESIDAVLRSRAMSWTTGSEHEAKNYFEDTSDEVLFTPEMYGARAKQMVAKGYTALKFDVDVPHPYGLDMHNRCLTNREIDYMLSLIGGVRDGIGMDIDLAIDCHWRFNVNDARKIAAGCEQFRLMWLEDPLPPWNVHGFKELKTCSSTPIATGENLYLFEGFRELIANQSLSIVSPDLQKAGGFSEARRIAEYADNYNVAVAPHNISSPVGTMASVHFCAATPNFLALEFHANDVPFWDDLLIRPDGKPLIQDGYIAVPDGPGLGFDLNEEVARKYARKGEPFFE